MCSYCRKDVMDTHIGEGIQNQREIVPHFPQNALKMNSISQNFLESNTEMDYNPELASKSFHSF